MKEQEARVKESQLDKKKVAQLEAKVKAAQKEYGNTRKKIKQNISQISNYLIDQYNLISIDWIISQINQSFNQIIY